MLGGGANTASCNLPSFHHPLHSLLEQKSSFALIYRLTLATPVSYAMGILAQQAVKAGPLIFM